MSIKGKIIVVLLAAALVAGLLEINYAMLTSDEIDPHVTNEQSPSQIREAFGR